MGKGQDGKRDDVRIVVGPNEAAAARLAWPDAPIVALVEAWEPDQAVLARSAGADVVVPTADLSAGWHQDTPGLAVAVSVASSLARRRSGIGDAARRSAHDLGQALSAINLAAELAIAGDSKNEKLLHQIHDQTVEAGRHAWRTGRLESLPESTLLPVDLSALLHRCASARPGVAVSGPPERAWVLGNETRLERLLETLIDYARRSETSQRIDVEFSDLGTVEMTVVDAVTRRSTEPGDVLDLDLSTLSEVANDLGGSLDVYQGRRPRESNTNLGDDEKLNLRLSLPLLPHDGAGSSKVRVPPDRMAIQAEILEGVLRHAPLPESLEAIVEAIEHQLPGTKCSLLLLDDQQRLQHGAGASLPKSYRDAIDGTAIGYGQGSCGTSAFLGSPVIAADVTTDPHWAKFSEIALEHDLRSCWSTPILAADGGDVLGTFAVYRPEVWEPDEAAVRLVSRFSYLAAVAIGHHRLLKALAESESRFRSAFEGASAGMALVDVDGGFLKVNPALCTMLGADTTELSQTNVLELIEPAHRGQITESWHTLLQSSSLGADGSPDPIELPIVHHSGNEPLWVSLRSSLVRADDDQPYFYVEIGDISATQRHKRERLAREAAEAASQAKTDFLALVSHELRTPLAAILGFAQTMQLVELDDAQRADSLDNILNAGQHLLDLINELLDLSLIETGQLATVVEEVDADEVIEEAIQILQPLVDSREITMDRGLNAGLADAISPGLAADLTPDRTESAGKRFVLHADHQCVRQVLFNLLGNAVKFTPPGGEVRVVVGAGGADTVRISVLDSGPGIPADALGDLFQPLQRLTSDAGLQPEGTGLGLSVTARLVEEMEGTIAVESKPGAGSCFSVSLPGIMTDAESPPTQVVGDQLTAHDVVSSAIETHSAN